MITPLSIYFEKAMVLIKASIPNMSIASMKALVCMIIDIIAMLERRFTPIISSAITLSGNDGPMIIRTSAIAIATRSEERRVGKECSWRGGAWQEEGEGGEAEGRVGDEE